MKTTLPLLTAALYITAADGALAAVRYVDANAAKPTPPYTNWATAAATIQDAVDAAAPGDEIVVTNGLYATGGRAVVGTMTNRVTVDKPLTVRSVNGPQFTVIQGYQVPGTTNGDGAIRCVYLTNGASLSGFTLTNGATRIEGDWNHEQSGGGLWCESAGAVASNCVVVGNSTSVYGGGAFGGTLNNCALTTNSAANGGGTYSGALNNCTLTGNSAYEGGGAAGSTLNDCTLTGNFAHAFLTYGGGAVGSTLNNCILTGNSASGQLTHGGGAAWSTLNNCTLFYNTAFSGSDNYEFSTLNYCCTTPLPTNGVGNITNAPLFVDYPAGNVRLQSNSPCINAGLNAYAPGPTDLDGNPRIVRGTVDIGAYEFQGPGSMISYAWLQQYGLPTSGSADYADTDGDGMNNWQEWRCGTDPRDALSVLRLLPPLAAGRNIIVTWQSVAGVSYVLERSTGLAPLRFLPLATNLAGQTGTTTYTNLGAAALAPVFYRVGVR